MFHTQGILAGLSPWLVLIALVVSSGCGPGQSRIDYPSRLSLITKLEGRLGTLRNARTGENRSFPADLDVSSLLGVPSNHVRARLGQPVRCDQLSATRERAVCGGMRKWVYPFFRGEVPRETYLVMDPNGSHITSATWRVLVRR